jgi:hypothetical protein
MDLPMDVAHTVHECVINEPTIATAITDDQMAEIDLSFYDALAYGLCSGGASSVPGYHRI